MNLHRQPLLLRHRLSCLGSAGRFRFHAVRLASLAILSSACLSPSFGQEAARDAGPPEEVRQAVASRTAPSGEGRIALGSILPRLQLKDGREFFRVRVTYISSVEMRFLHRNGVASISLSELTPGDFRRTGYQNATKTKGGLSLIMSPGDRARIGIDKLTAAEQSALQDWIIRAAEMYLREAQDQERPVERAAKRNSRSQTPPDASANADPYLTPGSASGRHVIYEKSGDGPEDDLPFPLPENAPDSDLARSALEVSATDLPVPDPPAEPVGPLRSRAGASLPFTASTAARLYLNARVQSSAEAVTSAEDHHPAARMPLIYSRPRLQVQERLPGEQPGLKLNDGTSWEAAPEDAYRLLLWSPNQDILIEPSPDPRHPFVLRNTSLSETIQARPVASLPVD